MTHAITLIISKFEFAFPRILEWCACLLMLAALILQIHQRRNARSRTLHRPPGILPPVPPLKSPPKTQESLLQEVNHRVKNNFCSIISLLQMKQDYATSSREAGDLKDMEAQIRGLAAVHTMLSASGWCPVNLGDLCRTLIHTTVKHTGTPCRITLSSTPSNLTISHAQTHAMTLIIHELTSNSIKHATAPGDALAITVTLEEKGDAIGLRFQDNGRGYPLPTGECDVSPASMGLRIIRDLVTTSLKGSVRLSNNGGATTDVLFPKYEMVTK